MQQTQLIGTYGFILNAKRELLIVQRAAHDSHPGLWELPGGGLDHGEDPKNATLREVLEETGLQVKVLYPLSTISDFSSIGKHRHVVRIAYLCKLDDDKQQVELSSEHSNYRWVPLDEKTKGAVSNFLEQVFTDLTKHPNLLEID